MPELDLADFETAFPIRFYMNLPYREDRRADLELQFFQHEFTAERFPAINGRWLKDRFVARQTAGKAQPVHQVRGLRAVAMTLRAVLREAERRKAERVLILQDNVVFHPDFRTRLRGLVLPSDWGLFYLGCRRQRSEAAERNPLPSPPDCRLEKVADALDLQAIAIHGSQFRRVRRALRICSQPETVLPHPATVFLELQEEIPTYCVAPNLAWQSPGYSNSQSLEQALYDERGNALPCPPVARPVKNPPNPIPGPHPNAHF
jgi:hypothetical protein